MVSLTGLQQRVLHGIQLGLNDAEISRMCGVGVGKEVKYLCRQFRTTRTGLMFQWLESYADPTGQEAAAAYLLTASLPESIRLLLGEMVRLCMVDAPTDLGDVRNLLTERVQELQEMAVRHSTTDMSPLMVTLTRLLASPNGLAAELSVAAEQSGLNNGMTDWIKLVRISYLALLFELVTPDAEPADRAT